MTSMAEMSMADETVRERYAVTIVVVALVLAGAVGALFTLAPRLAVLLGGGLL